MQVKEFDVKTDIVIVGGGLPAIVAAISAARMGVTVALINNRGFIGGNTSAEIGVCANGADGMSEFNFNARETGVLGEIILDNLYRNSQGNRYHWDSLLMDKIGQEKNISLFMNTNVDGAETDGNGHIISATGVQNTTEKRFNFYGDYFIDDTGDGTLGFLSGAHYHQGREAKSEYHESVAPDVADDYQMLSTLIFHSHDTGKPVKFYPPSYALDVEKSGFLEYRPIPQNEFPDVQWYYEIGGGKDQVYDTEDILQEHRSLQQGIWNYIKNSGKYKSENYDLDFVSCIAGKRESRRIMGDYVLNQNDIVGKTQFDDVVAYGGWSVDLHSMMGIYGKDTANRHYSVAGIYQIPYRSLYSENIDNLFIVGRCMSTSHVALGTTRVSATLSVCGNAVGTAAALCKKLNVSPRELYKNHIKRLQQELLKQDCYLPGVRRVPDNDLATQAKITASSERPFEMHGGNRFFRLKENLAFSLPVIRNPKRIYIKVRAAKDTELEYKIHLSKRVENYCPDNLLYEGKVEVHEGYSEIALNCDVDMENRFLLVELCHNPDIEVEAAQERITGVSLITRRNVEHVDYHYHLETDKRKKYHWDKFNEYTVCFRTEVEQDIYSPKNVANGFDRPHGLPNIWIADGKLNEWLEFDFGAEKKIRKMQIVLDSFLDLRIINTCSYQFNTIANIVKNIKIYAFEDQKYELIKDIKDNYQRLLNMDLNCSCRKLKIVCENCNGPVNIAVYGVHIFE